MIFIFPSGTGCIFSGIHLTNTVISSIMAMKCNRFVTNSLIFSYRSVLRSVGERINNEEKKKNENIMDFDDMEHFALELLIDHYDEEGNPVPSKIAREKSDGYEEIYIDEYQDSNYIQDAILRSVSKESEGGHNMFMVGDVKQSIYSLRLARPELFLEKYH